MFTSAHKRVTRQSRRAMRRTACSHRASAHIGNGVLRAESVNAGLLIAEIRHRSFAKFT